MSLSLTLSGGLPGQCRDNFSTWSSVCSMASSQLDGPGAPPLEGTLEASSADVQKNPQTPPFYVNEQQLCSRLLTDGWAFYHISKEDTGQPQERTFQPCCFYSWACSFSQGLLLMVMGESRKEGQPADQNLCFLPSSFFVTTVTVTPWTTPGKHPSSWSRRCGLQLKHLASVNTPDFHPGSYEGICARYKQDWR